MAEALVEILENVSRIVVYDMAFKKKCIEAIAAAVPDQARELQMISSKTCDLLPLVRDHVYHPDFLGSFNLTTVLPALVPGFTDESPEAPDGHPAGAHRLLFAGNSGESAGGDSLRRNLLSGCARDTLALVRLKERLDELAENHRKPPGG
jgi:hypothetical protein